MLRTLESDTDIVVADFEAGLGTLTRVQPEDVDMLVVVTEPTIKSAEVAQRALEMIAAHELGRVFLVANRVQASSDRELVERTVGRSVDAVVVDDAAVRRADAAGVSPFDDAREAPAVRAVLEIAATLAASA